MAEEAVARLTPRRQEIFRLVRENGLSYREVAEVLDLSPQTVANLMSLALADLRAALGPILRSGEEAPFPSLPPHSPRRASGSD